MRVRPPFSHRRFGLIFLVLPAVLLGSPLPSAGAAPARSELREVAASHFDAETIRRGREFRQTRYVVGLVQTGLVLLLIWGLALGPLGAWNERLLSAVPRPWMARALVLIALGVAFTLVRFPFTLFRYLHARDHGLRHDAVPSFLADWGKGTGLDLLLLVVVGWILLTVFSRWAATGWLISGAVVAVLAVGYAFLAPTLIDPIFHRFERLPDTRLESRLLDIANRAGVPAREVLVADASRRTRAANAYFTGIGSSRRIVLYDNLIKNFSEDEVELVVAHEVGHWSRGHLRRGLVLGLAATVVALGLGQLVLSRCSGSLALSPGAPILVLPAYALFLSGMLLALAPSNAISRRMETEADRVSLELTGNVDAFVRTQQRLGRENLSDVLPPRWIEVLLYTHPANARRIWNAEQFR